MPFSIMIFSIMTFSIMTFSIMTFSITTFSKRTLPEVCLLIPVFEDKGLKLPIEWSPTGGLHTGRL